MRKFCRIFLIIGLFLCSSLLFTGCDDDLILVTGVDLYKEKIYANLNDTIDLSYKVYPSNASNKAVTFWSTDESVASVDATTGKVTVKSYGEASIVIRSLDGGYKDSCKIVTNIDPESIKWDNTDKKLTEVFGESYSATTAMALNQVMKLKVDYLIEDKESDAVTNKNVKFTSSNTANIVVINEKEGIIKAVNNEKIDGDDAYSDITATIETVAGPLSITARVYINEYSSLNHLYLNYKNYNNHVLDLRNGSESILLTSGDTGTEFYAYITNMSHDIKTDYEMTVESSNDELFQVTDYTYSNGWYFFKLVPSESNEGTGTLYINTTCSDETGKTIRCNVNVTVQAKIESATASSTTRKESDGVEIVANNDIFSIDLTYYDEQGEVVKDAKRQLHFNDLTGEITEYIARYGNNMYKVKKVPSDLKKKFTISGYFFVDEIEETGKIDFAYEFYIRNTLEGVVVTNEKQVGTISNSGISSVTLPINGTKSVFAYATSFDFSDTEPVYVTYYEKSGLITIVENETDANEFIIKAGSSQGTSTLVFVATDGNITIEYEVTVNIVASIADIRFYTDYISGNYSGEVTEIDSVDKKLKIYFDIVSSDPGYEIECSSAIKVLASLGEVKEEFDSAYSKVVRFVEIDLSEYSEDTVVDVELYASRILSGGSIKVSVK